MRPADMYSDDELFEDDLYYFTIDTPWRGEEENYWAEGMALLEGDIGEARGEDSMDAKTAFHKASEQSDLETMALLLQNGSSVDESDPDEWTPLMKACSRGDHEVVDFLLCNGADPNAQKDHCTPLMACCVYSHVEEEGRVRCVQKLLGRGADVNAKDKTGMTALMSASSSGLDAVVAQLLLMYNININIQDKDGWNALFHAVNGNYKIIVKQLLNAGIDLKAIDVRGATALQIAERKGLDEILEILVPANKENETELVVRRLGEPLLEFLLEMPDINGDGGFYSDVRDLFIGLGMERIYNRYKINVGMHEFLIMGEDLKKLGIKLGPVRFKIKTQGIHRYHVYPWKKTSLHTIDRDSKFTFEDAINCLANVTKHLSVMCATLKYMQLRIPLRTMGNKAIHKDLITNLVNSYVELAAIRKSLQEITEISKKVKPMGEEEVDIVLFEDEPKNYRPYWYMLLAGSALALLYYKMR